MEYTLNRQESIDSRIQEANAMDVDAFFSSELADAQPTQAAETSSPWDYSYLLED